MGAPLIHTLRVRYGESDLQGIAFNAHYLNYFDIGMTGLWRAAYGNYQTMLVTRHFARCGGDVVAEGDLRHVLVDLQTLAKTPIPDWARDGLEPWHVPEETPG